VAQERPAGHFISIIMDLHVIRNCGNVLESLATFSISRRFHLHGFGELVRAKIKVWRRRRRKV
jgi:hypothetical protein